MSTLKKISEQILREVYGGSLTTDRAFKNREVQQRVLQVINEMLKTETLTLHFAQNEAVPAHILIGSYTVNVAAYSNTTSFTCTDLTPEGFLSAWIENPGEPWSTGEYWLTTYQDVTITITSEIEAGNVKYTIVIAGYAFPPTITAAEAEAFLDDCPETGYISFVFEEATLKLAGIGISRIDVNDNDLTIEYTPGLTVDSDDSLKTEIAATHTILANNSSLEYALQYMRCCDVEVNSAGSVAKITLPVYPQNYGRGQGVWQICNPSYPFAPYIPLPSGQYGIATGVSHNSLYQALDAITCFEQRDRSTIVFNKTVGEMPTSVEVQLLIVDPSTLSETDTLPIPPEMENQVVRLLVDEYRKSLMPQDLMIDNNDLNNGTNNNR